MAAFDGTIPDAAELAARAFSRLLSDPGLSPDDAVEVALRSALAATAVPRNRLPRVPVVRRHLDALRAERRPAGEAELAASALVDAALDALATLEAVVLVRDPDGADRPPPTVHGRAATGACREGDSVAIRVTTALPPHELADALAAAGFTDLRCTTRDSIHGRLDLLEVALATGTLRITRLPPRLQTRADRDLVHGRPLAHAAYESFLRVLGTRRD
jgi:beta-phosphoglucomutase-like phosphatase (HAD superfamily)